MLRSNKKVHPEGEGKTEKTELVSNSMNVLSPSSFEEKGPPSSFEEKGKEEEEETFRSLPTSNEVRIEDNVELGLQSESDDDSRFNSDSDVEMEMENQGSSIGESLSSATTSINSFDETQLKKMRDELTMWNLDLPKKIEKLFRKDFWDEVVVSFTCCVLMFNVLLAYDEHLEHIREHIVTFILIFLFYVASAVVPHYLSPSNGILFVNWFLMPMICLIPIFVLLTSPELITRKAAGLLEMELLWMMFMTIYCSWRRSIFFFTSLAFLMIISLVIVNRHSIKIIVQNCLVLVVMCIIRLCIESHLKGAFLGNLITKKIEKEKNILDDCLHTLRPSILNRNPKRTIKILGGR